MSLCCMVPTPCRWFTLKKINSGWNLVAPSLLVMSWPRASRLANSKTCFLRLSHSGLHFGIGMLMSQPPNGIRSSILLRWLPNLLHLRNLPFQLGLFAERSKARANMQQQDWMVSVVPTFCSCQIPTLPRSAWCTNLPSTLGLGPSRCYKGMWGRWPKWKTRVRWGIFVPLLFLATFTEHGLLSQLDIGWLSSALQWTLSCVATLQVAGRVWSGDLCCNKSKRPTVAMAVHAAFLQISWKLLTYFPAPRHLPRRSWWALIMVPSLLGLELLVGFIDILSFRAVFLRASPPPKVLQLIGGLWKWILGSLWCSSTSDCVIYGFHYLFFIYLIYQGRWPWYILMKMIPKERSSWASVPSMFQYIVTSYPPFGNNAKMGVEN